jgi:hypothetical protein
MKKAAHAARPAGRKQAAGEKNSPGLSQALIFRPPLKRRPGLFYGLLGLLGIWIAVLLTLYFVSVRPYRATHEAPAGEEMPGRTVPR